jgi:hypothetical protein
MAQGLCDTFQTTERFDSCQHMGGIGALTATSLEPALFLSMAKQRFKKQRFPTPMEQPGAKLAQHRKVKTEIL